MTAQNCSPFPQVLLHQGVQFPDHGGIEADVLGSASFPFGPGVNDLRGLGTVLYFPFGVDPVIEEGASGRLVVRLAGDLAALAPGSLTTVHFDSSPAMEANRPL
jgi:hypothetical protein